MTQPITTDLKQFKAEAKEVKELVKTDLATLRTGKASVQMLDPVEVQVYGSKMKINELANISAPDPDLIVIKPWDQGVIEAIEKAVASAGLNLNPVVDGEILRIKVPALTEERRKELVKLVHKKVEGGKVMLRSVRTDLKQEIEKLEGEDNVSEDDIRDLITELDDLTQQNSDQLDQMAQKKEAELMEF